MLVMWIYQRLSTPIVRRVRSYLADINDGFHEIISGMTVIQQFRQQARFGKGCLPPIAVIMRSEWRHCGWTAFCCVRC